MGFRDFVVVELLDIIENMHVLSFARPTLSFSAIAEQLYAVLVNIHVLSFARTLRWISL